MKKGRFLLCILSVGLMISSFMWLLKRDASEIKDEITVSNSMQDSVEKKPDVIGCGCPDEDEQAQENKLDNTWFEVPDLAPPVETVE